MHKGEEMTLRHNINKQKEGDFMMALAAQTSILSTVIVALVIIAIVAWIIRGMIQKKKRSGTFIGCDCGCANCPHSSHNPKNSKSQSGCGGCGGC